MTRLRAVNESERGSLLATKGTKFTEESRWIAPRTIMNDPRSYLGWPDLARFLPSLYRPWMFHPKNRKHTFSR